MLMMRGPALAPLLLAVALRVAAAGPAAPPPQWPPLPDPARLQYVGEICGPETEGREPAGKTIRSWLKVLLGLETTAEQEARDLPLVQPTGLFASKGILYVADPGRGGVLRYDLSRKKGAWLAKPKGGEWLTPVAVAAAEDGRLYVLDSALKRVFIVNAKGKLAGELNGDPQGLGQPAGLAVGPERVFVSDVANHRIMVYGLEGVFLQSFGRRGVAPGEFNFPTYLWFDRKERQLWVTDSANFRLQWFAPDGRLLGQLGENGNRPGYLARPRGVARDSEGHVYVTDGAFDAMQLFDQRGPLLLFVGVSGAQSGQFNLPAGVFIDENDRVFVADTQNRRVQVFRYLKEGAR